MDDRLAKLEGVKLPVKLPHLIDPDEPGDDDSGSNPPVSPLNSSD